MRPTLAYLLGLKYEVRLTPIPLEEEGGFCATIPELGDMTFVAEGDTEQEALENLEALRRDIFTKVYEEGKDIPLPKTENDFSGKFLVRIPKFLHRELYIKAKAESTSLNQLVLTLLTKAFYSTVQSAAVDTAEGVKAAVIKAEVSKVPEGRAEVSANGASPRLNGSANNGRHLVSQEQID